MIDTRVLIVHVYSVLLHIVVCCIYMSFVITDPRLTINMGSDNIIVKFVTDWRASFGY